MKLKEFIIKKIFIIFLIFIVCKSQLWAQHYITLGLGFSGVFYDSEDLDRFKETYNLVNNQSLSKVMQGIGEVVGLRWEGGYRYFGPLGLAVLLGIQNYTGKDAARYRNGDVRNLELEMNSLYVEGELGHTHNAFFVNGSLTFFFNRQLILESTYSGSINKSPLNGTYLGSSSVSTDMGIAAGIFKEPIIITGKISYPIFTRGGSTVLQDKSIEKVENGTDIFPNDYADYTYGKTYDGVSSDIDGLKILVTVVYAIPLKK